MYRRKLFRQRGAALLEAALLVPLALSGFIGIVASNKLYQSNRAVSWAVNQAVMVNGLRPTPTTSSVGPQKLFRVSFIPDGNGGTYSWSLSNPIPVGSRECKGGQADIACAAWISMTTMGQFINASLGASILSRVELAVTYDDLPVEAGVDASLGRYRKLTISATGHFDASIQSRLRSASGLGNLLPSFSVTRVEAIG
jgi:hypothetical protein